MATPIDFDVAAAVVQAGIDGAAESVLEALSAADAVGAEDLVQMLKKIVSGLHTTSSKHNLLLNDIGHEQKHLADWCTRINEHETHLDDITTSIKAQLMWEDNESTSIDDIQDSKDFARLVAERYAELKKTSEQVSSKNLKLTKELEHCTAEVARLKGDLHAVQTGSYELAKANANLKANLESCEAKLKCQEAETQTEKRLRHDVEQVFGRQLESEADEHQRVVMGLRKTLDGLEKKMHENREQFEAHRPAITNETITEGSNHIVDTPSPSVEDFIARSEQLEQQLEALRKQLKEAEAGTQSPHLSLGSQVSGPNNPRKRANHEEPVESSKKPRRDRELMAASTVLKETLRVIRHYIPSIPALTSEQLLEKFELPTGTTEHDVHQRYVDISKAKPHMLRQGYVDKLYLGMKNLGWMEYAPMTEMLLLAVHQHSDVQRQRCLEKAGTLTGRVMLYRHFYQEITDPGWPDDGRSLTEMWKRWGQNCGMKDGWTGSLYNTGVPTQLKRLYDEVEGLGVKDPAAYLWAADGPLTKGLERKAEYIDDEAVSSLEQTIRLLPVPSPRASAGNNQ